MGHVGTMVYGRSGNVFLDDLVYDDFFAAASELRQPVFIHPQLPSPAVRDASYRGFDPTTDLALATFGWGWHLDAGTAALRLILRGTFDRHPELQVVLGHWGEMLLFWLDRAEQPLSHRRSATIGVGLHAVELLHHHLRHAQPGAAAPRPLGDLRRPVDLLDRLPLPAADPRGDQFVPRSISLPTRTVRSSRRPTRHRCTASTPDPPA